MLAGGGSVGDFELTKRKGGVGRVWPGRRGRKQNNEHRIASSRIVLAHAPDVNIPVSRLDESTPSASLGFRTAT